MAGHGSSGSSIMTIRLSLLCCLWTDIRIYALIGWLLLLEQNVVAEHLISTFPPSDIARLFMLICVLPCCMPWPQETDPAGVCCSVKHISCVFQRAVEVYVLLCKKCIAQRSHRNKRQRTLWCTHIQAAHRLWGSHTPVQWTLLGLSDLPFSPVSFLTCKLSGLAVV